MLFYRNVLPFSQLAFGSGESSMDKTHLRFSVRNEDGKTGRRTMEGEVASFDWSVFKTIPNAEAFVRRAYLTAARKALRDMRDGKNGATSHHLETMETLVARSLKMSPAAVAARRGRGEAGDTKPSSLAYLAAQLPKVASSVRFGYDLKRQAADRLAAASDPASEPEGGYLFIKLTMPAQRIVLEEI